MDDVEHASRTERTSKEQQDQNNGICDHCLAVPWESFGTSEDPASFTKREPFAAWKYTVPAGHTWPLTSSCCICSFMRDLLTEYGHESTTSIRKLRGGWDGEKPFRMTFVEIDQEYKDGADFDISEDKVLPEGHDGVKSDNEEAEESDQGSDDSSLTIWEDDQEAYHTFSVPSFFTTSLEVEDFQNTMRGYKPTAANLDVVKEWLSVCNTTHVVKCCKQNRQYVRNLKVIDCARRVIVAAPPDCSFVALSYVWGPPSAQPDLISTSLDIVLPPTIEDSITVTRELGLTYLWIDRYVSASNQCFCGGCIQRT